MSHDLAAPPRSAGAAPWGVAALVALASLTLYAQVGSFAFLAYDDAEYVWENPVVRQGLTGVGLRWALTTLHFSNWHPLTWLSHMLDVEIFGLDAGAHHLVNAALHALGAALLLLVLARMTGRPRGSALAAALFALHPQHVESVAWVAERKDLLSTCFGLLLLLAYARHAERPSRPRLAGVTALLALSLMAKPMWVTAPFLLLLLDLWPLQRWAGSPVPLDAECPPRPQLPLRALLAEKAPLLLLAAASSAVTVVAQDRGGALVATDARGLGDRLANAVLSTALYLGQAVWPAGLSAFYPFSPPRAGPVAVAAVTLAALTALALWRARDEPWLLVGWLWFLGALVPVIGLVQVGAQARADRYTYLPSIGLFAAASFALDRAVARAPRLRSAALGAALLVLGTLSWTAHGQIATWRDQVSVFRQAIAATGPGNGRAQHLLSQGLIIAGRLDEALAPAAAAAALDPENPRTHKNLGYVLYRLGRTDEAIAALERAVALDPGYAEAHGNLGIAYARKGRMADALREMSLEAQLRRARSR